MAPSVVASILIMSRHDKESDGLTDQDPVDKIVSLNGRSMAKQIGPTEVRSRRVFSREFLRTLFGNRLGATTAAFCLLSVKRRTFLRRDDGTQFIFHRVANCYGPRLV